MNKQVARYYLEVLSPVHVGCDEVYEPTGFSVDEANKRLYAFDLMDFMQALNGEDRTKFAALCQKGTLESIRDIYRFMQNQKIKGKAVDLCEGFIDHYRRVLKMPDSRLQNELNRFEIARTSFAAIDQRAYIPGSSIKGALRTAYLNTMAEQKQRLKLKTKKPGRELEEALLNLSDTHPTDRISLDPFRMVKVSDFMPIGKAPTRIVYIVNKKMRPSEKPARGPYQIVEVILPKTFFVGEIIVDVPQRSDAVSMPLNIKDLFVGASNFYSKEKQREDAILEEIGAGSAQRPTVAGTTLLRVGRHSGAECVTIEGYRQIKILKGRGRPPAIEDHATTLWLASETEKARHAEGLKPLGWVSVGSVTDEMFQDLERIEKNYKEKCNQSITRETEKPHKTESRQPDQKISEKSGQMPTQSINEVWERPVLTWNPGNGELTASFQNKKAFAKGKDLVPESLRTDLFEKKKKRAIAESVEVEPIGNAFKVVKIFGKS